MGEQWVIDVDVKEFEQIIQRPSEEIEKNWLDKYFGKKYPILMKYQKEVNFPNYTVRLRLMLDKLKKEYWYTDLESFLVLKDILAKLWKSENSDIKGLKLTSVCDMLPPLKKWELLAQGYECIQ